MVFGRTAVSHYLKRLIEMMKYLLGLMFFFSINMIHAQNELEDVKKELFSENNYMVISSWTNYHKHSKEFSEGEIDTTYMHFCNDSVIFHNNTDSNFLLSTKNFFYSIHDQDSFVSFRIVDSTYIWGWNYPKIFDFIEREISNVSIINDTIYFILNKNIEDVSKVKYYKNDFIHLDLYRDTEYNISVYHFSMKPTKIGVSNTIFERMKKIRFVNDSLVFNNICSGYSIDCYDMSKLPTKHYSYINQ